MQTLISKKELLSLTKISYGQLYRWKRMNIIPEDWFIKKSTTTGQETFFEKDKILERIEFILSKKDEVSLEEIAAMLSSSEKQYMMPTQGITKASSKAIEVFQSIYDQETKITGKEIFIMAIIEQYLLPSYITMEELKMIINVVNQVEHPQNFPKGRVEIYRKFGVSFVTYVCDISTFYVEDTTKSILSVNYLEEVEKMEDKFV